MVLGIDELAQYVFLKHDPTVNISLDVCTGLDTSKDLFTFFLDFVCKGLVLMHGNDTQRVVVDDLSMDQFKQVTDRMKLLGIECRLDLEPVPEPMPMAERIQRMMRIHSTPDNLNLEDYAMEIVGYKVIYRISFALFHNVR